VCYILFKTAIIQRNTAEDKENFFMATEPIRNKKHIKQMAEYYLAKGNLRNYLLIIMGVFTALRISDLLSITWGDVYDFKRGDFKNHIDITEKKTGKTKSIAINKKAAHALKQYFGARGGGEFVSHGDYIFKSNRKKNAAISRVQAWRIIKEAGEAVGLARVSCHSLRKTFGYHAWRRGTPAPVIMDIYNHSSYAVTRRYLGINQDDRDEVYLKADF
jgi:integrase